MRHLLLAVPSFLASFQRSSALMTSARSALLCAWALCGLVFFDDYSCILIVGNSLSTALPALGVSRRELGVLIHLMGVCLASLSPVSSWAGLQLGYVSASLKQLGLQR